MSPHSAYTPCHRDKVWPPLTCSSCGYLCAGMSEEEKDGAWAGGQCRLPLPKHGVRNYPIRSLSHWRSRYVSSCIYTLQSRLVARLGGVTVGSNLGRTLVACGGGKSLCVRPVYGLWCARKPSPSVRQRWRWVRTVSNVRVIRLALKPSFLHENQ